MDGQSTPREQAEAMQFDSVSGRCERWTRALLELKQRVAQAERAISAYDDKNQPVTVSAANGVTAAAAAFETSMATWGAVSEVAFLRPGGKQ